MSDRRQAAELDTRDPNPTFEELVAKWEGRRSKGRLITGDAVYEKIIETAKTSRGSVNDLFGLDPKQPPPLPLVAQPSPSYARQCPASPSCALATAGPTGCSNYQAA